MSQANSSSLRKTQDEIEPPKWFFLILFVLCCVDIKLLGGACWDMRKLSQFVKTAARMWNFLTILVKQDEETIENSQQILKEH